MARLFWVVSQVRQRLSDEIGELRYVPHERFGLSQDRAYQATLIHGVTTILPVWRFSMKAVCASRSSSKG